MKTIFKEFIIVLLLILAIVLVLGIFFYDYIPMNKVVPKIEQYEPPKNVKEELEENVEEKEDEIAPIVREINGSDLNLYEKTKDYQKGKVNPFADTSSGTVTGGNTNTQNGNNTNNNNSNSTNDKNNSSNSEGNYLPSNGTK